MFAVLAVLTQGKPSTKQGASGSQSQTSDVSAQGTQGTTAKTGAAQSSATAAGGGVSSVSATGSTGSQNINEKDLTFSNSPAAAKVNPAVTSFGIMDLVRMVLILGLVVGLIYGVFYLLKRSAGGRLLESNSMRILGNLQLPGNRTVHLVEAGRQVFLVGGGEHGVSLISEITDQESLDDIRLKYQAGSPGIKRTFSDLLSGVLAASNILHRGRTAAAQSQADERRGSGGEKKADTSQRLTASDWNAGEEHAGEDPVDFLRQQRDRLKRLQQ